MNILKNLWKGTDIALAMSGLRLDAGRFLLAWIPLLGVSAWLAYEAEQSGWHFEFAVVEVGSRIRVGSVLARYGLVVLVVGGRRCRGRP